MKKKNSLISSDNSGVWSLGILCFQGFGIRIFEALFSGAIVIWLVVLVLLNKRHLSKVPIIYWIKTSIILFFYLVFNLLKGAQIQGWMLIAMLSASVVLTRYFVNLSSFAEDLRRLAKFSMYYDLFHIPVMLFLDDYIIDTAMPMEPKTFLGVLWYNKVISEWGLYRIQGFCWEPSCWNLLLNINLLYALRRKENGLYILLSIIAVLSTLSTTGMVTMVIIIALSYLFMLKRENVYKVLLAGGFILMLVGPFVYDEFKDKMETGSGQTRGGDFAIAAVVLYNNPWFGEDIDNITNVSYAMNARSEYWTSKGDYEGYMNQGFVNSFAGLVVEWGAPTFIILLILFFRTPLFLDFKIKILFFITMLLVLMGTPIARTGFFYMFPFSTLLLNKQKYDKNYI